MTTSAMTSNLRLGEQQVETFRREGYIIYDKPFFPQRKFDRLRAHLEATLARAPITSLSRQQLLRQRLSIPLIRMHRPPRIVRRVHHIVPAQQWVIQG